MKTKGITRTKQLVEALRKCDRQCADKLTRGFPSDNESAILLWTHPDGRKHWTIWHKKKHYDPHAGVFRKRPDYLAESRVTSHLKITL